MLSHIFNFAFASLIIPWDTCAPLVPLPVACRAFLARGSSRETGLAPDPSHKVAPPHRKLQFSGKDESWQCSVFPPDDLGPSPAPEQRPYFPCMRISHSSHQLYPISSWYARCPTVPHPPSSLGPSPPSTRIRLPPPVPPELPRKQQHRLRPIPKSSQKLPRRTLQNARHGNGENPHSLVDYRMVPPVSFPPRRQSPHLGILLPTDHPPGRLPHVRDKLGRLPELQNP